ncbi:MAG: DUF3035 domain-containing protein [Alphaproteobacteria bacterium]|nr:MAG: DUF3035 domain-containing protein [Alphaproteobacteria bacterium]
MRQGRITRRASRMAAVLAALALAACSRGEPRLMNIGPSSSSPDEFLVLPYKKLEMPRDLAALPEPTPGARNRADRVPEEEVAGALGGRLRDRPGLPAADRPLVAAVSRYGVDPAIRTRLAEEDYQWRVEHRGRILERLFGTNVYYDAYRPMTLDSYAELRRLRHLGIRTPAAPPPPRPQ